MDDRWPLKRGGCRSPQTIEFLLWIKRFQLLYTFSKFRLKLKKVRKPLDHSVRFSSVAQSCPALCEPMNPNMPGLSVHHQLPEFTQTHVHRVGDAIQPSHPLLPPFPPAPNPSQHQGLFQWVSFPMTLHMRWPKYWSFSFSVSPSNEHPGLISFRMDWLDLLTIQGALKSLLQHHSSKDHSDMT